MLPFQAAKQQQETMLWLAELALLQCRDQCQLQRLRCHLQQQAEQVHQK
jgi:hypothetical protein